MTFIVWHVLAIATVIVISFISGYQFATRKDKPERSIHMMAVKKTRYKYE
jgi:hypothetical protein